MLRPLGTAALLSFLIAGCAPMSPPTRGTGTRPLVSRQAFELASPRTVRIGALNIEWLGQPEHRKQPYNVPQDPAALADYLMASRVDVLALEEISDTDGRTGERTNNILDQTFALMHSRNAGDWSYVLHAKLAPSDTTQHVGIAWNRARVSLLGQPVRVPVAHPKYPHPKQDRLLSSWVRQPYAVKFSAGRGRTDFVLIALHMKSNVEGPITQTIRRDEAASLVGQVPFVEGRFADHDVVLLGDTNFLDASEPAAQVFSSSGFRDLNAADLHTYFSGAPFDRIYVPEAQPEFSSSVQKVLRPGTGLQDYRRRISDHFLVYADVSVRTDDD